MSTFTRVLTIRKCLRRARSRATGAAIVLTVMTMLLTGIAFASPADQARRLRHFDALQRLQIFQSMQIVNGIPRLMLGAKRSDTDLESLGAFCKIIFDYYAELDTKYVTMDVIDSVTGQRFATVDARGFRRQ